MRKIIGIGETILDIIFRKDANGEWQPQKSVAGGSTFNSIITLGRLGMNTALVTELGDDQVGKEIIEFMHKYNISTNYIDIYKSNRESIINEYLLSEKDITFNNFNICNYDINLLCLSFATNVHCSEQDIEGVLKKIISRIIELYYLEKKDYEFEFGYRNHKISAS